MGSSRTIKRDSISRSTKAGSNKSRNPLRSVLVFTTLLFVLALTSILLRAMDGGAMTPDAASSLFSVDAPNSLDVIFETQVPCKPDLWKSIYIHQSATPTGNATSVCQTADGFGEHFLIGNGDGCIDGELQLGQRWNKQETAAPPWGTPQPDCIAITVVGDFSNTSPTPTQLLRLQQLVQALQSRYRIPADQVWLLPDRDGIAGIGRHFPLAAFREQLQK